MGRSKQFMGHGWRLHARAIALEAGFRTRRGQLLHPAALCGPSCVRCSPALLARSGHSALASRGSQTASAIPAFAKKTGLRCSACHEAWPKLNAFGQAFRDNGYQIGNERDSPVYQSPLYWPAGARYTPQWHRERNSAEATDQSATGVQPVTTQGFDLSGIDLWYAGLLAKNISFVVLPSSDEYGNFHFESGWVRFDNLLKSPWLNVKTGKYELDMVVSEKRMLTLSQVGGIYQMYHYLPLIDPKAFAAAPLAAGETGVSTTAFGIGDNQFGIEIGGHSHNDYTRYTVSVLTSSDGAVNLPTSKGYDTFMDVSRTLMVNSLGPQTFGAFNYIGQSPTQYLTQTPAGGGAPANIPGSGYGNKGFTRTGGYALLSVKKLDIVPTFMYATEKCRHCAGDSFQSASARGRAETRLERPHAGALLHAESAVHRDRALRRDSQLASAFYVERSTTSAISTRKQFPSAGCPSCTAAPGWPFVRSIRSSIRLALRQSKPIRR
jgi:hypothetical protein